MEKKKEERRGSALRTGTTGQRPTLLKSPHAEEKKREGRKESEGGLLRRPAPISNACGGSSMALAQIQTQPAQSDRRNAANRVTASNRYYTWVLQLGVGIGTYTIPARTHATPRTVDNGTMVSAHSAVSTSRGGPLVLKPNPAPDAHTRPDSVSSSRGRTLASHTAPSLAPTRTQPLRRHPHTPMARCRSRVRRLRLTEALALPPHRTQQPPENPPLTHALPPARMRPRTGCNSRAAAFTPARCTDPQSSEVSTDALRIFSISARLITDARTLPLSTAEHDAPLARLPPARAVTSAFTPAHLKAVLRVLESAGYASPISGSYSAPAPAGRFPWSTSTQGRRCVSSPRRPGWHRARTADTQLRVLEAEPDVEPVPRTPTPTHSQADPHIRAVLTPPRAPQRVGSTSMPPPAHIHLDPPARHPRQRIPFDSPARRPRAHRSVPTRELTPRRKRRSGMRDQTRKALRTTPRHALQPRPPLAREHDVGEPSKREDERRTTSFPGSVSMLGWKVARPRVPTLDDVELWGGGWMHVSKRGGDGRGMKRGMGMCARDRVDTMDGVVDATFHWKDAQARVRDSAVVRAVESLVLLCFEKGAARHGGQWWRVVAGSMWTYQAEWHKINCSCGRSSVERRAVGRLRNGGSGVKDLHETYSEREDSTPHALGLCRLAEHAVRT
ncbi:hypothetical protein C8R46DRAFT_1194069 [Mycena filopes]|nr:hypothetical protein C8R46DRAFT_1194069 [Mycena filopes]